MNDKPEDAGMGPDSSNGGGQDRGFLGSALVIVAALAVIGGLIWWGIKSRGPKAEPAATETAAKAPVVPEKPDPIIATVDGMPIKESEFTAAVASLPQQMQQIIQLPAGRERMIKELVRMKLLEREARKFGIDKKPEIKAQVDVSTGNILANAAVDELVRQNLVMSLEQLYQRNLAEFESVKARQIIVAYQGGIVGPRSGAPLSEADAMAKANRIAAELRGGADFATLAKKESDEPQVAKSGGDMGELSHSELPDDVDKVLFALPANGISDPLRTRHAIHVFQVTEKKTRSFDEVRPAIERQERQFRIKDAIEELNRKAKVDLNKEWVQSPGTPVAIPTTPSQAQ